QSAGPARTGRVAGPGHARGARPGRRAPPRPRGRVRGGGGTVMLRLTWIQPEDLLGHELRQAAQGGPDATEVARRWRAAGGPPAPERAGASPGPTSPQLRSLAGEFLDELAALPVPGAAAEPTAFAAVVALCPAYGEGGAEPGATGPTDGDPGG